MASWELQCLSAIINGAEGPPAEMYEKALRHGVRFDVFGTMDGRNLWAKIESHYTRIQNFGHIPSPQEIAESMPMLTLPTPGENFQDLCRKVVDGWARRESDKHLQEFLATVPEDVTGAITSLYAKLGELQEQAKSSTDVNYRKVAMAETTRDLLQIQEGGGMTGMPWPWVQLNRDTGGIQPGDFIMVWALPKSMKTWFGMLVAADLYRRGKRVLIYSKEMRWDAMRKRVNCLLARVDYSAFKNGTLDLKSEIRLYETVAHLTSPAHPGELFFTDADRPDGSPGGPNDIRRKIDQYKPDFVMLDSSYMLEMPDAGSKALDWKVLAIVSRQLKQIAKTTGIPTLAILQENERAAMKYTKSRGTASIAMNSGAVMDADLGLRLVFNKRANELSIIYAACRETAAAGFTISAIPCTNFDYVGDHLHSVGDDSDETQKEKRAEMKMPPKEKASELIDTFNNRKKAQHLPVAGDTPRPRAADEFDSDLAPEVAEAQP